MLHIHLLICGRLQLKRRQLLITCLAIGLIVSLELFSLRDGVSALHAHEAQLVVGLSVERDHLGGVHRLSAGRALHHRRLEQIAHRLRVLAQHRGLALVLLHAVRALRAVLRLVRTGPVQLLVALRTQRLVVVVAVVAAADDVAAVQALEAELVVHFAQSREALREHHRLVAGGTDRVFACGVQNHTLHLALAVVGHLTTNKIGALKLIDRGRVSSHTKDTHAHLLEVLQLVQIVHTEQIHLGAADASGKGNKSANVLTLQKYGTMIDLRFNYEA